MENVYVSWHSGGHIHFGIVDGWVNQSIDKHNYIKAVINTPHSIGRNTFNVADIEDLTIITEQEYNDLLGMIRGCEIKI